MSQVWEVQVADIPQFRPLDADGLIVAGDMLPTERGCVQVTFHPVTDRPLVPAALDLADGGQGGTFTVHDRSWPTGATGLAFLVGRHIYGDRVSRGQAGPVVTAGCALRPEEFGWGGVVPWAHRVRVAGRRRWWERIVWELRYA